MSPPGVYAAGDWRSDAHLADRRAIVATIETLLPIPGRCKSEWEAKKRTRAMARRLEEGLYAQAVSFEEYNDLDTLHRRVQDMATAIAQAKRTAQGEVPPPPPPVAGRGADQSPAQTTAESPHSIRGTVDSAEWEAHHEAIVAASAMLSSPAAPTAEQQEEHAYGRMDDTDVSLSSAGRDARSEPGTDAAVASDTFEATLSPVTEQARNARARAAAAAAAAARTSRLREATALTDDNDDASFWHMSDATSDAPQGAALAVSDAARSDSTPHTLSPLAAEARWASGSSGGPGGAQSDEGGSGGGSAAARSSLSPPPRSAAAAVAAAAAGAAALSAEEGCGAAAAAAPTHQRHTSDATVDTDASYYDTLDEADRMPSESDMVSAAGTVHTSATAATVRASVPPPPCGATPAAAPAPPAAALSPASAQAASIEAASAEAASVATALAPAATAASLMAPLAKASVGPRPVSAVARPRPVSTAAMSAPRSSLLPAAAAAATGTAAAAAAPRTAAAAPLVLRTAAAEAAAPRPAAAAAAAAPRPTSAPRTAPLRRPPMVEPAGPAPRAEEQWRSEAHAAHRKRMVARILELLTSSGKRQGPEWRRKNRVMARRLEDALYTDAAAFAEYDDDATLAARLHAVAMQFTSDAARAKRMSDRARAAVIAANEPRAKPAAAPHKAAKAAQPAEAAAAAAAAAPHQRSPHARPSSAPQPSLQRSPRPVPTAAAAAAAEAAAQQQSAAAAPPQQTTAQALRPVPAPAPHHTVVPEPPTWHATARKAAAAAAAGARPRASSSAAAAPSVAPLTHVERRRAGLTLRSDSLDSSVQSGSSFGSPLADVSPSNWSSLRAIAAEFPAVPGGSIRP